MYGLVAPPHPVDGGLLTVTVAFAPLEKPSVCATLVAALDALPALFSDSWSAPASAAASAEV